MSLTLPRKKGKKGVKMNGRRNLRIILIPLLFLFLSTNAFAYAVANLTDFSCPSQISSNQTANVFIQGKVTYETAKIGYLSLSISGGSFESCGNITRSIGNGLDGCKISPAGTYIYHKNDTTTPTLRSTYDLLDLWDGSGDGTNTWPQNVSNWAYIDITPKSGSSQIKVWARHTATSFGGFRHNSPDASYYTDQQGWLVNRCIINVCRTDSDKKCYNGDVYYYDSCGNRGNLYQNCTSSQTCSGGQCISCTPEYEKKCAPYSNDVYWYDSCGNKGSVAEYCGSNKTCAYGYCVSNTGTIQANITNNDDDSLTPSIYVDGIFKKSVSISPGSSTSQSFADISIGSHAVEIRWTDNGVSFTNSTNVTVSAGLTSTASLTMDRYVPCYSHSTKSCYNGDVYWYDSCSQREDIYWDCASNQICSNNSCITQTGAVKVSITNNDDDSQLPDISLDGGNAVQNGSIASGASKETLLESISPGSHSVKIKWYDYDTAQSYDKTNPVTVTAGQTITTSFAIDRHLPASKINSVDWVNALGNSLANQYVTEGDAVYLAVNTQNVANGTSVSMDIYKRDSVYGQDSFIESKSGTINNNSAKVLWTSKYQGPYADAAYYFIATANGITSAKSAALYVKKKEVPQCTINSVKWNPSGTASEWAAVKMIAETSPECNGKTITYTVKDLLGTTIETKTATAGTGVGQAEWNTVWFRQGSTNPKFYFTATIDYYSVNKTSDYLEVSMNSRHAEALNKLGLILNDKSTKIIVGGTSNEVKTKANDLARAMNASILNASDVSCSDYAVLGNNLVLIGSRQSNPLTNCLLGSLAGYPVKPGSIEIIGNPWKAFKNVLLIYTDNEPETVHSIELMARYGVKPSLTAMQAVMACFTGSDSLEVYTACNILPVIELGVDGVETYNCLANNQETAVDKLFCYVTYGTTGLDVGQNLAYLTGVGIIGGVLSEGIDVGSGPFKAALKALKGSGKVSEEVVSKAGNFIKSSEDNLKLTLKTFDRIEESEAAYAEGMKLVAKKADVSGEATKIIDKINQLPKEAKLTAKQLNGLNHLTEFKALTNGMEVDVANLSPDLLGLVGESFSDGKFSSMYWAAFRKFNVEKAINDNGITGWVKKIKFQDTLNNNPHIFGFFEQKTGELTLAIKSLNHPNGPKLLREFVFLHELAHATVFTKLTEAAKLAGYSSEEITKLYELYPDTAVLHEFLAYTFRQADEILEFEDGVAFTSKAKEFINLAQSNQETINSFASSYVKRIEFGDPLHMGTKEASFAVERTAVMKELGGNEFVESMRTAIKQSGGKDGAIILKIFDEEVEFVRTQGNMLKDALSASTKPQAFYDLIDNFLIPDLGYGIGKRYPYEFSQGAVAAKQLSVGIISKSAVTTMQPTAYTKSSVIEEYGDWQAFFGMVGSDGKADIDFGVGSDSGASSGQVTYTTETYKAKECGKGGNIAGGIAGGAVLGLLVTQLIVAGTGYDNGQSLALGAGIGGLVGGIAGSTKCDTVTKTRTVPVYQAMSGIVSAKSMDYSTTVKASEGAKFLGLFQPKPSNPGKAVISNTQYYLVNVKIDGKLIAEGPVLEASDGTTKVWIDKDTGKVYTQTSQAASTIPSEANETSTASQSSNAVNASVTSQETAQEQATNESIQAINAVVEQEIQQKVRKAVEAGNEVVLGNDALIEYYGLLQSSDEWELIGSFNARTGDRLSVNAMVLPISTGSTKIYTLAINRNDEIIYSEKTSRFKSLKIEFDE